MTIPSHWRNKCMLCGFTMKKIKTDDLSSVHSFFDKNEVFICENHTFDVKLNRNIIHPEFEGNSFNEYESTLWIEFNYEGSKIVFKDEYKTYPASNASNAFLKINSVNEEWIRCFPHYNLDDENFINQFKKIIDVKIIRCRICNHIMKNSRECKHTDFTMLYNPYKVSGGMFKDPFNISLKITDEKEAVIACNLQDTELTIGIKDIGTNNYATNRTIINLSKSPYDLSPSQLVEEIKAFYKFD